MLTPREDVESIKCLHCRVDNIGKIENLLDASLGRQQHIVKVELKQESTFW